MPDARFVELTVTCGTLHEAGAIADVLLEKRLIACAQMVKVRSKYRWQYKLEEANEIKLVMEARAADFDKIEAEIARLHSYDTFVLYALPITQLSGKAEVWLTEATKPDN